jgi:hypothetical protein
MGTKLGPNGVVPNDPANSPLYAVRLLALGKTMERQGGFKPPQYAETKD